MERVSRNAQCPCGSGRKHKVCCGILARSANAPRTLPYPMYPGWDSLGHDERASLWTLMKQALNAQKAGNLVRAGDLYGAVIEQAPETFDALHMLGVIEMEFGNFNHADELMSRASRWLSSASFRSNQALLQNRRKSQEGIHSLRAVAAVDAIALFASQTPAIESAGNRDACLLRPNATSSSVSELHVVVPGDVLSAGANRIGIKLRRRYAEAGFSVTLWCNPQKNIPKADLADSTMIDPMASRVPSSGVLVVVGSDIPVLDWLPKGTVFEEIYLLLSHQAPEPLMALLGQMSTQTLSRLRVVARSANVLAELGLPGLVDPLLFCGPHMRAGKSMRRAKPGVGVFILSLGRHQDQERWEMLTWLRAQGVFIRLFYPGRLPSAHLPDEEEHLVSLVTDWNDDWSEGLDALFFWGAEGRAHQFDTLLAEARAAGLAVVAHGYAETAGCDAADGIFFTKDEAIAAVQRLLNVMRQETNS